jgi:hypothetical protein
MEKQKELLNNYKIYENLYKNQVKDKNKKLERMEKELEINGQTILENKNPKRKIKRIIFNFDGIDNNDIDDEFDIKRKRDQTQITKRGRSK